MLGFLSKQVLFERCEFSLSACSSWVLSISVFSASVLSISCFCVLSFGGAPSPVRCQPSSLGGAFLSSFSNVHFQFFPSASSPAVFSLGAKSAVLTKFSRMCWLLTTALTTRAGVFSVISLSVLSLAGLWQSVRAAPRTSYTLRLEGTL